LKNFPVSAIVNPAITLRTPFTDSSTEFVAFGPPILVRVQPGEIDTKMMPRFAYHSPILRVSHIERRFTGPVRFNINPEGVAAVIPGTPTR
jgi:hypothetical protein